jgi:hypothetical protein
MLITKAYYFLEFNMKETKAVNKIGLRLVLGWILGLMAIASGVTGIIFGRYYSLFDVLAGLVIFPPSVNFMRRQFNVELSAALKVILFLGLSFISFSYSRR